MDVFTGCSGFMYPWWRGRFYPEALPPSKWLEYYASVFNSLELNSSFYRFPRKSNLKRMARQTPDNFYFIVKFHRDITHNLRFAVHDDARKEECSDLVSRFIDESFQGLGQKLLGFLIQLPPNTSFSEKFLERMFYHIESYLKTFLFCVEFRNVSWWNDMAISVIREKGVVWVMPDSGRVPRQWVLTSNTAYIRFHGRKSHKYNYSEEEMGEWIPHIKNSGLKRLITFFNNDYMGYAPQNALLWNSMLSREK